MDVGEYIENLQREGELLADSNATVDPARRFRRVRTGSCAIWCVTSAASIGGPRRSIREARTEPIDLPLEQLVGGWPDDADLVDWFRDGHRALVQTLPTPIPTSSAGRSFPRRHRSSFWARRQTHETAIHRVDAQSAPGRSRRIDAGAGRRRDRRDPRRVRRPAPALALRRAAPPRAPRDGHRPRVARPARARARRGARAGRRPGSPTARSTPPRRTSTSCSGTVCPRTSLPSAATAAC